MKLPPDAVIAPEKLVNYLLVKRARGDKSAFLASAGYSAANSQQLSRDLRGKCSRKMRSHFKEQSLDSSMKFGRRSPARAERSFEFAQSG